MALIDKDTFEIFSDVNSPEVENTFECDDFIAPAIRVLNLKGYKTRFCCSGHPFLYKTECVSYHSESDVDIYKCFPGVYSVKEVELEDLKDTPYYDGLPELIESEPKPTNKKLYFVKLKQFTSDEAYITFEEGMAPDTLPEGWEFDEDLPEHISIEIPLTTEMDFFFNQLKIMEKLLQWANDLPVRE